MMKAYENKRACLPWPYILSRFVELSSNLRILSKRRLADGRRHGHETTLMKRNQVTACDLWTSDPRVKRAGATPTTDLDHHRP